MCSKNKGADQLCSYCTADLRLCFRIGKKKKNKKKKTVFLWSSSDLSDYLPNSVRCLVYFDVPLLCIYFSLCCI